MVSPTQFVIYETLTQGPLLLDADAGVISVLVDLLGMGVDEIPSLLNEEGYNLAVRPIPGDTTDAYRLITYGVGNEGNFRRRNSIAPRPIQWKRCPTHICGGRRSSASG